jgi:poly(A) polymerase
VEIRKKGAILLPSAIRLFEMLRHYGLFAHLYPVAETSLSSEEQGFPKLFIARALENTDKRIAEGKSIAPFFLISTFLKNRFFTFGVN